MATQFKPLCGTIGARIDDPLFKQVQGRRTDLLQRHGDCCQLGRREFPQGDAIEPDEGDVPGNGDAGALEFFL